MRTETCVHKPQAPTSHEDTHSYALRAKSAQMIRPSPGTECHTMRNPM